MAGQDSTGWVQVLGRIAVHVGGEARQLPGSSRRLLAVLVAAGPDGTSAERIAEEIWGENQPDPWRPALRMAIARLRKRLPADWDIVAASGSYRVVVGAGWVDAWRLEQMASSQLRIAEEDLHWMLAGPPFGDLDLFDMVSASTQTLKLLQVGVIERFCAQQPSNVSTITCSRLVAAMHGHPYNDRLALTVVSALSAGGRHNEAVTMLTAFAETFLAEFDVLPADLADFLVSAGEVDLSSDSAALAGPADWPSPAVLPKELRHIARSPLLGREREVGEMLGPHGAIVVGASGSGKSRMLAEAVIRDHERESTYVVGDDRIDMPLGPFAVALPSLREELLAATSADERGAIAERLDPAEIARSWRIVLGHFEERSLARPQRLVVDDAHLLDNVSLGLLRLLVRSNTTADLVLVIAGRDDVEDQVWLDIVQDASRSGFARIELRGMELEHVERLVFERFPNAVLRVRQDLASEVFDTSSGLPAIVVALIAAADGDTLALPEQLTGLSTLARVTSALSSTATEALAAASVLGQQFSVGALIALTEFDEAQIFESLDELWGAGLIIETDDPDQVRFRHVFIQRASLEGLPVFRRSRLHRTAAELTDDPHERADHQANAAPFIAADVAAASLLHSAQLYAERQLWRSTARELRRVKGLPGEHLDAGAHTLWAVALDRSGSDGSGHRRIAHAMAVAEGDWRAALLAALSGLPETERPDGDPERVGMLESIDDRSLTRSERFELLATLGRQYNLLGQRSVEGRACADRAIALANNPDEVGLAQILRWQAGRNQHQEEFTMPATLADEASLPIRLRLAQINAIELAERGDFEGARVAADKFHELAATHGSPFRLWHARAFEILFLMNEADFAGAHAIALANMKFAEMHDIRQGVAAYVGQQFFVSSLQGQLAELHPQLETVRANLMELLLGRAALVLCAYAAGAIESREVGREVRAIVGESTERGGTLPVLTMQLLAPLIAEHAPDHTNRVRRIFERFGDKPVLASFGGLSMGPTVRYVAQISTDRNEKVQLVARSIAAADRHGSLLWRVKTRLDGAELGSLRDLQQASQLAKGTDLEPSVDAVAATLADC